MRPSIHKTIDISEGSERGGTYRVEGVLLRLHSERHLVDIELLVHELAKLLIVHLASSQHLHCALLQRVETRATRSRHLLLEVGQLRIALIDLGLDHLASLVQLWKTQCS